MSVNVDKSLRRWSGWVLVGYAVLWAGYVLAITPSEPMPWTVESVGSFVLFTVVYGVLIHLGFNRLADTGGFACGDDL